MRKPHVLLVVMIELATTSVFAVDTVEPTQTTQSLDTLRALYPGIRTNVEAAQLRAVYGTSMATGATPEESAERFRIDHAAVFGAASDDLSPGAWFAENRVTQPVMFDHETGLYKFTLVYYSQHRAGIPVFRGEMRVLVRNEPGNPVVWVKSTVRNLGDFVPQQLRGRASAELAVQAATAAVPTLINFTEPQTVIWAGVDDVVAEPITALTFVGDNGNLEGFNPQKEIFVVDAATGAILFQEDQILEVDVEGNVSGMTTDGNGAGVCHSQVLAPHPYGRVYVTFPGVFADVDGDFVLPNAGTSDVTLTSTVQGERFNVSNAAGSPSFLSPTVTPPGPVQLIHNESVNALHLAEVDAYIHANLVRDFVLSYEPLYPVIFNQLSFLLSVNEPSNDLCPCNAQYTGSRLRFCRAGGGCNNTAFSTVVHHEYGHHLVQVAGSGQGQYGEGMGDVMGVLITEDSQLGKGFTGNCNAGIRTADNNMQYPCSGAIHTCGQLISGCVWDMRSELLAEDPVGYYDVLSGLTIASIMLHTGSLITPQITLDILTLDDDDADLTNGTPHYHGICAGYGAHNMAPDCDPDCNANNVPDPWEVSEGLVLDDNGNGIPDSCDPDCNGNSIPDDLDLANCAGEPACSDCNNNLKIDECDISGCAIQRICGDCDGNGVPNQCEVGVDTTDCDGDGICNAVQIANCSGSVGCQDCNANGWPDSCDLAGLGSEDDCNANSIPDTCDVADLTSPDVNANIIPDECEFAQPLTAAYPHDRRKNRYFSFDPDKGTNDGFVVAFRVELKSINQGSCDDSTGAAIDFCRIDRGGNDCNACVGGLGGTCINTALHCSTGGGTCTSTGAVCANDLPHSGGSNIGQVWWLGPEHPSSNGVHLLVSEPFRKESDNWPNPTHAGDCEVVPQANYGIRAFLVATSDLSNELQVKTTVMAPGSPAPFWWADAVGSLVMHCNGNINQATCADSSNCGGDPCERAWTLPNGSVNFDDVNAALALVAPGPTSIPPHPTWVDLHGGPADAPPNSVLNSSDLQQFIFGFGGLPYAGFDPADCPDVGTWP